MSQIKINYYNIDDDNALLGDELFNNIDVCELPYDPENEKIFIRKIFSNITHINWKVIDIQVIDDTALKSLTCEIYLSPILFGPVSIAAKHGSNGSKLLRGRLVECDFGYFSQDYRSGIPPATTIDNYTKKLPFEMVKRRLVVIVSNKEDPALVIPISKTSKAIDPRTVVNITSLPKDLVHFTEPSCFAKTASITQVSGHRLFPLRYYVGGAKSYDARIEKKLSDPDVVNIRKAAFIALGGAGILSNIDNVNSELEEKKQELSIKNKEIEDLNKRLSDLNQILDDFTNPDG